MNILVELDPYEESDPVHLPLLVLFFSACTGIWFFGYSRWKNLLVSYYCWFFRQPSPEEDVVDLRGREPHVTIQICAYNEAEVVEETIARCCNLDWPADKVTIQVCDDSTDKESIAIIENAVLKWNEKGARVQRKERPDRLGYKAGNLNYNFKFIEGDFIAYLDSDHQVTKDFLRKTIPHFFDCQGRPKDHIGLVQTPWSYYNTHQNLLAECDALGLDIHHVVEQVGRHRAHKVFGFNGTGGVWRKKTIEAAGLFSWETVTEDLLLSYKSYLAGYEFHYVRDCPQQLEVPACFLAHIQQKQRWTKGFIQVLRMFFHEIMLSAETPFHVKLEAFMHLSGPLQLVMTALVLLIYPYLVYHQIDSFMVKAVSVSAIAEPVLAAVHAIVKKVPGENGHYGPWWSRVLRLAVILPYFSLRFGMSAFEVKAIIEGFCSNDATFLTTPKEGSKKNVSDKTKAKKVKKNWADDFTAFCGLFLALHQTCYVFIIDGRVPIRTYFDIFIRAMNVVICVGLYWVNASFLLTKYCRVVDSFCLALSQRKELLCGMLIVALTNCLMVMVYLQGYDDLRNAISLGGVDSRFDSPVATVDLPEISTISPWSCTPRSDTGSKAHDPLVVFGEPRTGSNLFFSFLNQIDSETETRDIDVIAMYELFNHDEEEQVRLLSRAINAMHTGCGLPTTLSDGIPDFATPTDLIKKLRSESDEYNSLFEAFENRYSNPVQWVQFVSNIPSASSQPVLAFKIFNEHLNEMSVDPVEFAHDLLPEGGRGPIVLWRRRIIESFVSYKIAVKKSSWLGEKTTAADTIQVDKAELEAFIAQKRAYYTGLRQGLRDAGVPFEVFEYARDLADADAQRNCVEKLVDRFELSNKDIVDTVLGLNTVKKQAQVALENQVENWSDVVAWGYGGEVDQWEDFFA